MEHETVADERMPSRVGQDLAQPAEGVGAVAVQLLDTWASATLRRRPRSAIFVLGLAVAGSDTSSAPSSAAIWLAQRGESAGEQLDLAHRALADLALLIELLVQHADPGLRLRAGACVLFEQLLQPAAVASASASEARMLGKRILEVLAGRAFFQREKLGQLVELGV